MKQSHQNQSGITLLVAVVLLAAVTFISFSVSTIIIREIQSGRLTLRSEPALSAANSGGEIGLYRLFRGESPVNTEGTFSGSNVSYEVAAQLYVSNYSFQVNPGPEVAVVALYFVEDIEKITGNYDSVTISLQSSSGPANFRIVNWTSAETNIYNGPLFVGANGPYLLNSSDDRYVIYILPTGTSKVKGSISAEPLGVPSDSPTLDVKGTNGPVQRRIEITL
mgnify:CR=1 FL=1